MLSVLQWIVLAAFVVMNIIAFSAMAIDKSLAKKKKRRIPEKTLFMWTICFGGIGGVLGMQVCRHKTKHWYFAVFFPIIMVVQLVLLVLVWKYLA